MSGLIDMTLPSSKDGGAKHDQGKTRFDLLPFAAVEQVAEVLTKGAAKYSPGGWRQVTNAFPRYFAAMLRHTWARALGERTDPESGLPHLAHVACNALFLVELDAAGKGEPL